MLLLRQGDGRKPKGAEIPEGIAPDFFLRGAQVVDSANVRSAAKPALEIPKKLGEPAVGLIVDDGPEFLPEAHRQEKVAYRADERVEILIEAAESAA